MISQKEAAFLIIGNEILSGRTQDQNLAYLGAWLVNRGITLKEASIVSDIENQIIENLNRLRSQYDYVFTSGGIGPTHDDITANSIAKAFNESISIRQDAFLILENFYGKEHLTDSRIRMARIPKNAKLILNSVSGAPGFYINNVFVLAGVPKIQRAMLEYLDHVIERFPAILSVSIDVNAPESQISDIMNELQESSDHQAEVGSYPFIKNKVPGVNVVIRSFNPELLFKLEKTFQNRLTIEKIVFSKSDIGHQ